MTDIILILTLATLSFLSGVVFKDQFMELVRKNGTFYSDSICRDNGGPADCLGFGLLHACQVFEKRHGKSLQV